MISWLHDKQTTVRLPDDLANEAETVARVHGAVFASLNFSTV
jgi:hypothetical protein